MSHKIDKDVKKLKLSYTATGNVKLSSHFGKVMQLLKKLNIDLPYG